jgi:signal transduction histidine kinase
MSGMGEAKRLPWVVAAFICAAIPIAVVLDSAAGPYGSDLGEILLPVTAVLACTGVGLIVTLRAPGNPIGWLLLANGAALVLSGLLDAYSSYGIEHPGTPGSRLTAVLATHIWPLLFAGVVAIAFVFPDGKLLSRRWRWIAAGGGACFLLVMVKGILGNQTLDPPFEEVPPYDLLPDAVTATALGVGLLGMIATFIAALVCLVMRFRRADAVRRQQLKWVVYAGSLIPLAIVLGSIDGVVTDSPGALTFVPFMAVEIAIPAAIGVAVLRYRLYEIDRLISATLVYGVLTVLLGAAFAGVTLLGGVVIGGDSNLSTAAATLAVAVAFRPLRSRVQAVVDRRFNRARYQAMRKVDVFLEELRLGRAQPEAVGAVISDAASDPTLRLLFWLPRDGAHADEHGRLVTDLPSTPAGRTPVLRGELDLGTIVHDPDLPARVLDPLILRAGLAIEIARLRVEVRRQLAEVEQSRARIVTATYEERRRLERDLHDGAQQRLVSIGLDLRHLQHGLGSDDGSARAELDTAVSSLTEAIEELRALAQGVRPAALDDGLAPALQELASRAPVATTVEVTEERFEGEIEAAAYFVASEALTNAVKHASGSGVTLRAARNDGRLVLSVTDDGGGGAEPGAGSGLTGLADRVAALGGTVELQSDGDGTSIVAEFPCES